MAQKYVVQVIDDLDGTELDQSDVRQIRFGLDGRSYVIDLSSTNAKGLHDAFAPYADAARRDQGAGRAAASAKPTGAGRKDLDQVREWANTNGHTVSDRGRIPNSILEAYDSVR